MDKPTYYLFGLQRSGTNYMETLMRSNFEIHVPKNRQSKSWKHSIDVPGTYDRKIPTMIIYKNPYLWVESICLRNSVDWKKKQLKYSVDEKCDPKYQLGNHNFNIINLIKTYSDFLETWFYNNPCDKRYIVKYEDLLLKDKREGILADVAEFIGASKRDEWINPDRGRISQSKDYDEERERYYINATPKKLTPVQIEKINETLRVETIRDLGYDIL